MTLGANQFSHQHLVTVLSSKARAACVRASVALQRLVVQSLSSCLAQDSGRVLCCVGASHKQVLASGLRVRDTANNRRETWLVFKVLISL